MNCVKYAIQDRAVEFAGDDSVWGSEFSANPQEIIIKRNKDAAFSSSTEPPPF